LGCVSKNGQTRWQFSMSWPDFLHAPGNRSGAYGLSYPGFLGSHAVAGEQTPAMCVFKFCNKMLHPYSTTHMAKFKKINQIAAPH
jgi:hypothetical protein